MNEPVTLAIGRSQSHDEKGRGLIQKALSGLLLLAGLFGMARDLIGGESGAFLLCLLTAAALMGLCLLLPGGKKLIPILTGAGGLILILLFTVFRESLTQSLGALLNQAAAEKIVLTGYYVLPFEGGESSLFAGILLSALTGLLLGLILRRGKALCLILCGAAGLGLFALTLFGTGGGSLFLIVYAAGFLLTLMSVGSGKWQKALGRVILMAAGLALVLLLFALTPLKTVTSGLADDWDRAIHHLRYEGTSSALPEGDLTQRENKASGQSALEVTMENWQSLYIRGFVGANYTGSGFKALTGEDIAEEAELLYGLQSTGFTGNTELPTAREALPEEALAAVEKVQESFAASQEVTIENAGACRAYTYAPVGGTGSDDSALDLFNIAGEGNALSMTGQAVTWQVFDKNQAYFLQNVLVGESGTDPAYLTKEAVYRDFAKEHFLDLPSETATLLKETFPWIAENLPTTTVRLLTAASLGEVLSYKEYPASYSGKSDYAEHLLTISREGNSYDYAALSVLIFRACGIPARYVEGYLVTENQADILSEGETLTLTDHDAHAWAEFYLDGVGWIPFDADPSCQDLTDYPLPADGSLEAAGQSAYLEMETLDQEDQADQEPQEVEEDDRSADSGTNTAFVIRLILILLLILLAGLAIYLLYHRQVRKKREESFLDADTRLGCGRIYTQALYLLGELGLKGDNRTLREKQPDMADLLEDETLADHHIRAMEALWYGQGAVTGKERDSALDLLDQVRRALKKKKGRVRYFLTYVLLGKD